MTYKAYGHRNPFDTPFPSTGAFLTTRETRTGTILTTIRPHSYISSKFRFQINIGASIEYFFAAKEESHCPLFYHHRPWGALKSPPWSVRFCLLNLFTQTAYGG